MENEITIRAARAGDAHFLSELLAELGYPAAANANTMTIVEPEMTFGFTKE